MTEAYIIAGMLGAATGSFASLAAYRIPLGLSVIRGRSFCDHCGRQLEWHALVPVLSFLVQRGRCRKCGARIPLAYAVVEVLLGAIAVVAFARFGLSPDFFSVVIFAVLGISIAIIDWRHLVIPDPLIVSSLIAGCVAALAQRETSPEFLFVSSFGALLLMLAIRRIATFFLLQEAMGFGDVKLAAVIGLFTGFSVFLFALWVASIAGTVYAITVNRRGKIPFGAFLAGAGLLCLLFHDLIMNFYQALSPL